MAEVELPNPEELEETRGKAFTRRVALTTAFYAVLLAITSLGGSHAMKEMLLAQQQSSDQWAFYQAKAMREHLYKGQKVQMDAALLERGASMKAEARQHYEALIKKLGEEEARYAADRKKIEEEARQLEHERDVNRAKDPYFEFAEVLLQIAIVTASVSILALSPQIYYFSMIAASLGTLLMINGYFLLVRLPLFR